eukprot:CAMPEP_0116142394 /NCGR_PEP_ID=MMETSP0329-20121206/14886_1 /TAXON_ID=697910 /ORGANISM="Pseudo-nitzschia arenysensis, Strain B593" /LENGTH=507 /DNA_ID=CAMNT_0003637629 /DNA_START=153 /DNA_END=1673 /DNA_ORIENTATION=-
MTKQQNYDELEIDERPRVCGGAIFLKLMKKGKCPSPSGKKNDSPMLTSSSASYSSSQASSMIEYDPNKTQFCMPRQIDGEDGGVYKLDFKLHTEENSDFMHLNNGVDKSNLFFGEPSDFSHGIVHLNPQAVNHLKNKHLQSMNDGGEKGSGFEPRNSFKEETKSNDSAEIDAVWNELQAAKQTPSRAKALRKEMSSFRKELNAVKRSLPNQFETNVFEEDDSTDSNSGPETPKKDPEGLKVIAPQIPLSPEEKYFKKDWNLNFQDRRNVPSDNTPQKASSRPPLEPQESFPECPEMPFDQGLNVEDIALQSSSLTTDEEREPVPANSSDAADYSNYQKDMHMVQMLLKKYGDKIDDEDKQKIVKSRRLHAVVDPPTDAWFHRHASGVCKKPEKLSVSDLDAVIPVQPQTPSRKREPAVPERVKQMYETPPRLVAPKKSVHFNDVATYVSAAKHLKSSPGRKCKSPLRLETSYEDNRHQPVVERSTVPTTPNYSLRSPGRLSAKIKYW